MTNLKKLPIGIQTFSKIREIIIRSIWQIITRCKFDSEQRSVVGYAWERVQ